MNSKSQLDILAEQFSNWRSTRGGSRLTPSHLAKSALAIMDDYPRSEIFKALGINSNAVRRWEKKYTNSEIETDFVDLETSAPLSTHESLRLEIMYDELTLNISGSSTNLVNFVNALREGRQ